ncbi:MAG: hypothetical protein AABZ47_14630 [Planctomycetota bacterium]
MSTRTLALVIGLLFSTSISSAVIPTEIQQPGTQPFLAQAIQTPSVCAICHSNYASPMEPYRNWNGSMMAHASRDPVFWAALAIAEQDFPGSGDLCLRCHVPTGWLEGRSTPTDGSALVNTDAVGVSCDQCHRLTNPNDLEFVGEQSPPFVANDGGFPPVGYYGSGMFVLWNGSEKLGPYETTVAPHDHSQSLFHRSTDFCGTCHDVSNPAVGDLAHNNGAFTPLAPGTFSGVLGSPVNGKAAFNNFPYQYGVVERTFSEYKAGSLHQTLVSNTPSLPADLQAGAIQHAYQAALQAGTGGNYADGTPRYFTCQTCHMPPVTGEGCSSPSAETRTDLPLHDLTGANYWVPQAIEYMNAQGQLRLGGGMTTSQITMLNEGRLRAIQTLQRAASLSVNGNTLRVVNLTGHKLITGYPEGRRMWLNIKWYDAGDVLVREDGAYGNLAVDLDGKPTIVRTLLDLNDPNTKVYETHYAMTKEWADQLIGWGYDPSLALDYDRVTGAVSYTLGNLAAQSSGTHHVTFHFVLNNTVDKDNRIPTYGMSYDEALLRNAIPVPANQYGNPGPGQTYNYWDDFTLNPPATAVTATIDLLYQPTSWEYIQFLNLANIGGEGFLANEGVFLVNAWLNTSMAEPEIMASTTWPSCGTCNLYGELQPPGGNCLVDVDDLICLLQGFANMLDCPGSDLYPCDGGDGIVDVDDLIAELAAFAGDYFCPHPCAP